jgi:predicted dinucleotide-binding enzyme
MQYGVLGTGVVGQTLGSALIGLGHRVCMGSRSASNEAALAWASAHGEAAQVGTFAEAAEFGEVVINGTAGVHSLAALDTAGPTALDGKVVIDVANPLDFSGGFPPRLSVVGDDSLAEQIQRAFPDARVVKALNTVTASVMVDPGSLSEPTDLFIAGDDDTAKAVVTDLLVALGWSRDRVRDLGGLSAARATETYLMLWVSLMGVLGTAAFNVRLVSAEATE